MPCGAARSPVFAFGVRLSLPFDDDEMAGRANHSVAASEKQQPNTLTLNAFR